MIIFPLVKIPFKFRFISTLITLIMTLQMSACGTEEFLTAVAPNLGSGSEPVTEIADNHAALISGVDSASVTEDVNPNSANLEVGGTLEITDPDTGEAAFSEKTVTGIYGKLTITSAGTWSYTADNNQSAIQSLAGGTTLIDNLIISSVDGTLHTITITIFGADENNTTANITLSWNVPVQREDNSTLALDEIEKHTIYFGTTSGQYTNQASTNSDAHIITGLLVGTTYYFVITTTDTDGRESQHSTEVPITI